MTDDHEDYDSGPFCRHWSDPSDCDLCLMNVIPFVSAAGWMPERNARASSLLEELGGQGVIVCSSKPQHSREWALHAWQGASKFGTELDVMLFLNDDVIVHPQLCNVVRAMAEALHLAAGEILSLHTQAPEARTYQTNWLRAYWVTGPAYAMRRSSLPLILEFEKAGGEALWTGNEDGLLMQWIRTMKIPAWHPIPAVVMHDWSLPTTRPTKTPPREELVPWSTWRTTHDLTSADYWRPRGDEPLVNAPW